MLNLYPNSIKVEDGTTHQQIPLTAIKGEPGQNGQNGTNGTNGVSCTHSWSGTTLNVTSASGTSSADLKGAKGDSYTITSADYEAIAEIAEQEYATDLNTVKEDIGNLDDLSFDADDMVDAVNKAYNHIIDFPIFICSQTLYDYISYSGTTRKNFYLRYKTHQSYNSYMDLRKISVPNGYKIMFRISASICTSDGNYFEIGINDTPLISGMTWSGDATNYSVGMLSNLFSFEELPIEKAYMFETKNDAFNMYCKNNASGTGYARDITIHAYLVKNTSE